MADDTAAPEVEYRDVPGFPGYRVGNDGSVWSRRGNHRRSDRWRRLRTHEAEPGKPHRVNVYTADGSWGKRAVGRLVLRAFVGPPPPGAEVVRADRDSANDRLDNLRWGTHRRPTRPASSALPARHAVPGPPRRPSRPRRLPVDLPGCGRADNRTRTPSQVVAAGRALLEAREGMKRQRYGRWLAGNFDGPSTNADRFVAAARRFGHLADYELDRFGIAALYLLALAGTPAGAREEAVGRVRAGQRVEHKDAVEMRERHRATGLHAATG